MAVEVYSILFQKMKDGAPIRDLLTDFSMVCTDFPFKLLTDTKGIVSDDWAEEHGEDAFIPDKLPLKAYDLEIGVCYAGEYGSSADAFNAFFDYLTGNDGNGSEIKIYNPYTKIGRQKLYLLGASDDTYHSSTSGDVTVYKVKFRVTDPKTKIIPVMDANGNATNLIAV